MASKSVGMPEGTACVAHAQHVMLSQAAPEQEQQALQTALPRQRNLGPALALCAQQNYALQVLAPATCYSEAACMHACLLAHADTEMTTSWGDSWGYG